MERHQIAVIPRRMKTRDICLRHLVLPKDCDNCPISANAQQWHFWADRNRWSCELVHTETEALRRRSCHRVVVASLMGRLKSALKLGREAYRFRCDLRDIEY